MGCACGFGGLAIGAAALGMNLELDVRYVLFANITIQKISNSTCNDFENELFLTK
jgi:pyruvate/2-oxoglutarate/acetoin dehydrogenase E1 component